MTVDGLIINLLIFGPIVFLVTIVYWLIKLVDRLERAKNITASPDAPKKHKFRYAIFALYFAVLCIDLNPVLSSQLYRSHFGKSYPDSHVYQWIIVSNKNLRNGPGKAFPDPAGACTAFDHSAELIKATNGETYSQLIHELNQIDAKTESDPKTLATGGELFRLHPGQIEKLKIPDDQFRWPYAPTLEISLKHLQREDFQIVTAHLLECLPMI